MPAQRRRPARKSAPRAPRAAFAWRTLQTLQRYDGRVIDARGVEEALAGLRSDDFAVARDSLLDLRSFGVPPEPGTRRTQARYCTMQPPLCTALIDGIAAIHERLRGPALVFVGDMLASQHALFVDEPDVHAELRRLHRHAIGRAVVAAVRARRAALVALAAHPDPEVRAGALFVAAMLPTLAVAIAGERVAAETDVVVRHLACFVAGMHHVKVARSVFSWLGSTLAPPALPIPADLGALAERLPDTRFPFLRGNVAELASRRAIACGEPLHGKIADRLLDVLATHPAVAEAAVAAAVTERRRGIPPTAMTPREARAVALTATHEDRIEAFEHAGISADRLRRAAWLAPSHPIDRPVPRGLAGSARGEPLGSCLHRLERAGRLPAAFAQLAKLLTPADYARVVVAAILRAYDLVVDPAPLLPALEAAGAEGVVIARELLAAGSDSGSATNSALLAIARATGVVPSELVSQLWVGKAHWVDVMRALSPEDRDRVALDAVATIELVEDSGFWTRRVANFVVVLAEARSAAAIRALHARASASEHGPGFLATLRALALQRALDVPGL